jgi:hypothetical protein
VAVEGKGNRLQTAIFRQVNKNNRCTNHDPLEFPNGQLVLLTILAGGQQATVLQLPAANENPKGQQEPTVSSAARLDWADAIG